MTFILRLLMIAILCGGIASQVGDDYASSSYKGNGWRGNFYTFWATVVAARIGMANSGFGIIVFGIVALTSAYFMCERLAWLKSYARGRHPIRIYICTPLERIARGAGIAVAAYAGLVAIFKLFPLPVDIPFSLITDVLRVLVHKSVITWLTYALAAYLSITAGTALRIYKDELRTWWYRRRAANASPVSSTSPGVND